MKKSLLMAVVILLSAQVQAGSYQDAEYELRMCRAHGSITRSTWTAFKTRIGNEDTTEEQAKKYTASPTGPIYVANMAKLVADGGNGGGFSSAEAAYMGGFALCMDNIRRVVDDHHEGIRTSQKDLRR